MSVWFNGYGRHDVVTIPRVWLTFGLSLLIHAIALITLVPRIPGHSPWQGEAETADQLTVELVSQSATAPAPPPAPASAPPSKPARAVLSAPPRPRDTPREAATKTLAVATPQPAPVPPPAPASPAEAPRTPPATVQAAAAPSVGGDLSSFIAARRMARGESPTAAETDRERRDRLIASNMPAPQSPIDDRSRRGGGIFEITRMTYDDAEFLFFGWNNDARRRMTQAFEVRLGNNSDMRIAVVRRMIALIREHESGDFSWQSYRLGRVVTLSARPEDNAGLEEFMLHEFFDAKAGTP